MRMALMAGGTGGLASLLFLGLGPVAEAVGIQSVRNLAALLYIATGIAALAAGRRAGGA